MISVDRRLLYNVDWALVLAALLVTAIGIATIFSATHNSRFSGLYMKQMYAVGLGLVGLVIAAAVDYRRLADRAPLLFLLALGVLGAVLLFGPRIAGTRRWFVIGGFQVQPSEFAPPRPPTRQPTFRATACRCGCCTAGRIRCCRTTRA